MPHRRSLSNAWVLLIAALAVHAQETQVRQVAPSSTLTIKVGKTGLFSFAGHEHVVAAPVASSEIITAAGAEKIHLVFNSADLKVLDPDLDADTRAQVQRDMRSEKVLDVKKYPQIIFDSTQVRPAGPGRWQVTGDLQLHGVKRPVTFDVTEKDGVYEGEARIQQTQFGITPVSAGGGTVKVKDELKIGFSLRLRSL